MLECLTEFKVDEKVDATCTPCPVDSPTCNPHVPTCNPNLP
ncbi:MAG: hypothetical protein ACI4DK_11630 [Lachnospiraceae bacterium]